MSVCVCVCCVPCAFGFLRYSCETGVIAVNFLFHIDSALKTLLMQRAWTTEMYLNKLPITKLCNLLSDTTAQFPDLCFHAAVCRLLFIVKNRSCKTQTSYRNDLSSIN